METNAIELMRDQARAIYRAVTGAELPEPESLSPAPDLASSDIERRFVELQAMARAIPAVSERVPPYSFEPPLDAIDDGAELVLELGIPGIAPSDVVVERDGSTLVIKGLRGEDRGAAGRTYFHAEIPRGPFRRAVELPCAIAGEPRIDVARGLVRVHLTKQSAAEPDRRARST